MWLWCHCTLLYLHCKCLWNVRKQAVCAKNLTVKCLQLAVVFGKYSCDSWHHLATLPLPPSLPIETKHRRFDIEAYYRNKTKTFWFGPLIIGTKAERFSLFQNCLKSNRNVLAIFLSFKTKPEWNRVNLVSDRNVSIHLGFIQTKGNFCEQFPNFFTSLERFCLP